MAMAMSIYRTLCVLVSLSLCLCHFFLHQIRRSAPKLVHFEILFLKCDLKFSEIWCPKSDFIAKSNKNTKCPIDAHCHRHCRKDPRITKDCIEVLQLFNLLSFHWLWQEVSQRAEKLLDKVEENSEAQNLQNLPILCNPWIFSAMAMAMSIYSTAVKLH